MENIEKPKKSSILEKAKKLKEGAVVSDFINKNKVRLDEINTRLGEIYNLRVGMVEEGKEVREELKGHESTKKLSYGKAFHKEFLEEAEEGSTSMKENWNELKKEKKALEAEKASLEESIEKAQEGNLAELQIIDANNINIESPIFQKALTDYTEMKDKFLNEAREKGNYSYSNFYEITRNNFGLIKEEDLAKDEKTDAWQQKIISEYYFNRVKDDIKRNQKDEEKSHEVIESLVSLKYFEKRNERELKDAKFFDRIEKNSSKIEKFNEWISQDAEKVKEQLEEAQKVLEEFPKNKNSMFKSGYNNEKFLKELKENKKEAVNAYKEESERRKDFIKKNQLSIYDKKPIIILNEHDRDARAVKQIDDIYEKLAGPIAKELSEKIEKLSEKSKSLEGKFSIFGVEKKKVAEELMRERNEDRVRGDLRNEFVTLSRVKLDNAYGNLRYTLDENYSSTFTNKKDFWDKYPTIYKIFDIYENHKNYNIDLEDLNLELKILSKIKASSEQKKILEKQEKLSKNFEEKSKEISE